MLIYFSTSSVMQHVQVWSCELWNNYKEDTTNNYLGGQLSISFHRTNNAIQSNYAAEKFLPTSVKGETGEYTELTNFAK